MCLVPQKNVTFSLDPRGYNTVSRYACRKKISHTVCDLTGLATESELLSKFIIQLTHIFVKCPNSVY